MNSNVSTHVVCCIAANVASGEELRLPGPRADENMCSAKEVGLLTERKYPQDGVGRILWWRMERNVTLARPVVEFASPSGIGWLCPVRYTFVLALLRGLLLLYTFRM